MEFHGNGNKTPTWEWEGVGIHVDENGIDLYSYWKKIYGFFAVVDLR